jgi:hypothetical protein
MTGEPDPQPEQGIDARVAALETGQETLSGKLDQILGIIGDGGHGGKPAGPEPPATVGDEIRAQLDARDARARADSAQAARDSDLTTLKEQVAALAEKPPEPLPRRIERIMGWS